MARPPMISTDTVVTGHTSIVDKTGDVAVPDLPVEPGSPKSPFKPYNGDMFGVQRNYDGGMIYLSKMKLSPNNRPTADNGFGLKAGVADESPQRSPSRHAKGKNTMEAVATTSSPAVSQKIAPEKLDEVKDDRDADSELSYSDGYEGEEDVESKREVAAALKSLLRNPDVHEQVLSDGLIQAFQTLSKTADKIIRRDCSEAMCFLTCNPVSWSKMIEDGAIAALMALASPEEEGVASHITAECALNGLANLACQPGTENVFVVQNAIVPDVMKHITFVPQNRVCLMAIGRMFFNLVNVDASYVGLEMLAGQVIRLCKTAAAIFHQNFHFRKEEGVEAAVHAARGGAAMPVTLHLACADLPQMDDISGSDPMVVVRQQVGGTDGPWLELGRTEVISNATTVKYKTRFHSVYNPGEVQNLQFIVYDIDAGRAGGTMRLDLAKQDYIGQTTCTLDELIMSQRLRIDKPLVGADHSSGTMTVRCTPQEPVMEDPVDSKTREFLLGALYLLAHIDGMPLIMLHDGILSVLRTMLQTMSPLKRRMRLKVSAVISSTLYVLSVSTRTCWLMVEQGLFQLVDLLVAEAQSILGSDMAATDKTIHSTAVDVMCMCIGTYANITFDDRCRWRMLLETPARTIILMCSVSKSVRVRACCALVLHHVASEKDSALKATSMGALEVLIQMANSDDPLLRKECFVGLCAVLASPFDELYACLRDRAVATMAGTIEEQANGIASAIIKEALSSTLNIFDAMNNAENIMGKIATTREHLIHTIRNISCSESGRDILVNVTNKAGNNDRVILLLNSITYEFRPPPVGLQSTGKKKRGSIIQQKLRQATADADLVMQEMSVARQAADALYFLSLHSQAKQMILHDTSVMARVVADITVNRWEDPHIVFMKLALLYNLTDTIELCKFISSIPGMNKALINRAMSAADNETRIDDLCSGVLCRLCENKRSVEVLVRLGLFPALIALTHTPDRSVRERCVLTMSIMADADIYIRKAMVDQGALPVLMEMAGSYDPKIRQNSVAALCELTSCKDVKQQMVDQGSVKALVLTGLIRASEDDPETCTSCCKALYNLLSTEDRFDEIVQDGVVWALTAMLGLGRKMRELGIMGLCNIASHKLGREEMSNANTLKALINLATTRNPTLRPPNDIRAMCGTALHNLACGSAKDYREAKNHDVVRANATDVAMGSEGAEVQVARTPKQRDARSHLMIMTEYGAIRAFSDLAHLSDAGAKEVCTAALAELAANDETQEQFVVEGGLLSLVSLSLEEPDLVGTKVAWAMMRNCAIASYCISTNEPLRKRAVRDGAMQLIHAVLSESVLQIDMRELCCRAIENYARDPLNLREMVDQGAIEALSNAVGIDYDRIMKEQGFGQDHTRSAKAHFVFEENPMYANRMSLFCVRTICRLSTGMGSPAVDLVQFGAVSVLRAMADRYFHNIAGTNKYFQTVESVRRDISCALCSLSYTGDTRRIVREGAVPLLIGTSQSGNHETQEMSAIAFHNLASNESNHSMIVTEGGMEALVDLGKRSRNTQTLHYVATSLCALTMDNAVREQIAKRNCSKALATLYSLLSTMSVDEVTPRYIALAIANLSRVPRAQLDIVQILDVVPLVQLASNVTDVERGMLELRERLNSTRTFEELDFTGTNEAYVSPSVSSNLKGNEWSTHDFDPHRTTPKEPGLPEVKLAKRRHIKASKSKKKRAQQNVPAVPSTGNSPGKSTKKGLEHKDKRMDAERHGRVNRYSNEVLADGPCIVTNATLQNLLITMFNRSCLSHEDLSQVVGESELGLKKIVNLHIDSESEDDDDDSNSEKAETGSWHSEEGEQRPMSALTEYSFGAKSDTLPVDDEHLETISIHKQDDKSVTFEDGPLPLEMHTHENSNASSTEESMTMPMTNLAPIDRESSRELSQGQRDMPTSSHSRCPAHAMTPTVRVATAALSALKISEMERERRRFAALRFVQQMQAHADREKARADANLRKSLLEHTYKWAIAERDKTTMAALGEWQGALVRDNETTSRQSLDQSAHFANRYNRENAVPLFMADGLERLMRTASRSSSIGRSVPQEGKSMKPSISPMKQRPFDEDLDNVGEGNEIFSCASLPHLHASEKTKHTRCRSTTKKKNLKRYLNKPIGQARPGIVDLRGLWP